MMELTEEYFQSNGMNNSSTGLNLTQPEGLFDSSSPFRFLFIRIIFGLLYAVVFFGCICGNALVIFVIVRHQRMRNITNFFLANLAASDICVGVFCVIPNLMTYFTTYWYAGKAMCKFYFFIQSVSYTASIIILTVIAMERYFAIIHPMLSKRLSRMTLMRSVIVIVWLTAAACGIPSLFQYDTVSVLEEPGPQYVEFCMYVASFKLHNTYVLVNFVLLYCCPLILIAIMYTRVSIVLWQSSAKLQQASGEDFPVSSSKVNRHRDITCITEQSEISNGTRPKHDTLMRKESAVTLVEVKGSQIKRSNHSNGVRNALTARRKVIRLLIAIVGSFAACMLPHHVRLLYELWAPHKYPISFVQHLIPPFSFLLFYMNSALNPVLYAFLSENFRSSLLELCGCRRKSNWMRQNNASQKSKGAGVVFHRFSSQKMQSSYG